MGLKQVGRVWAGLIWLRIERRNFGLHKTLGIFFDIAEELSSSNFEYWEPYHHLED
jgi:hypothetical protein